MKRTVAILGENVEQKLEIGVGLASASYPIVLQVEVEQEKRVKRKISKHRVNASIDTVRESFSCAWEADVVIVIDCEQKLGSLAKEIENYVTGKIIIILLGRDALTEEVKSSFRYAKTVFVYSANPVHGTTDPLDFFSLALSSERGSGLTGHLGSPLTTYTDTKKLIRRIERLLEVFY